MRRLIIELEALKDSGFITDSALGIHGLFFKLIEEVNSQLSEFLHDLDQLKPYTLSSLKDYKGLKVSKVEQSNRYFFSTTILQEEIFKSYCEGLHCFSTNKRLVKVGHAEFIIVNYYIQDSTSFEDIILSNRDYKQFKLVFKSPTSFRRLGKNYLFPDSEHIIKSYIDKWNAYAPPFLFINEEECAALKQLCYATKFDLKTELINMGKYKVVGFIGTCHYQLDKKAPEEIIVLLNRFLHFIPYCGTGYKTTMGMGETLVER